MQKLRARFCVTAESFGVHPLLNYCRTVAYSHGWGWTRTHSAAAWVGRGIRADPRIFLRGQVWDGDGGQTFWQLQIANLASGAVGVAPNRWRHCLPVTSVPGLKSKSRASPKSPILTVRRSLTRMFRAARSRCMKRHCSKYSIPSATCSQQTAVYIRFNSFFLTKEKRVFNVFTVSIVPFVINVQRWTCDVKTTATGLKWVNLNTKSVIILAATPA